MAGPFKRGDRVVGYCRYSEGDDQGMKNVSTEEQAAAIRDYCDAEGLTLVRIFADPFASGRSVVKRDSYLEMLSFLLHRKKPDVQGVVLWDFERYGRNYDQAQLDAARLRMAGYKLFSLQQPIVDDGLDPAALYNSTLELSEAVLRVLRADDAPASAKRSALASFIHSIVIDRAGNVVVNYMPPGYSCSSIAPRPENKKAEDGSVVSHPRSILPAPPGVGRFGLQFHGVFLRTRKPRTRRRR